jgi:hypothetical protein
MRIFLSGMLLKPLATKIYFQFVVGKAQGVVGFHAFPGSVAAMPDGAVISVHCPADLHQRLVCQLMRQKEC